MSYTPTTWQCNDTITAAKLNKIEQGIASVGGVAPLIVNETYSTSGTTQYYTLDQTWQTIADAYLAGTPVLVRFEYDDATYGYVWYSTLDSVTSGVHEGTTYYSVSAGRRTSENYAASYETTSANGFPVYTISGGVN